MLVWMTIGMILVVGSATIAIQIRIERKIECDRRLALSLCSRDEQYRIYRKSAEQETEWAERLQMFRGLTLEEADRLSKSICVGMGTKPPKLKAIRDSVYDVSVEASYAPFRKTIYIWRTPTVGLVTLVHELTHHVIASRAQSFNPVGILKFMVCDTHGDYFCDTERALFKIAERTLKEKEEK